MASKTWVPRTIVALLAIAVCGCGRKPLPYVEGQNEEARQLQTEAKISESDAQEFVRIALSTTVSPTLDRHDSDRVMAAVRQRSNRALFQYGMSILRNVQTIDDRFKDELSGVSRGILRSDETDVPLIQYAMVVLSKTGSRADAAFLKRFADHPDLMTRRTAQTSLLKLSG